LDSIIILGSLHEYFCSVIERAQKAVGIQLSASANSYAFGLLDRFSHQESKDIDVYLATSLVDALVQGRNGVSKLIDVGDCAMALVGMFPSYAIHRSVHLRTYVNIAYNAFQNLASIFNRDAEMHTFFDTISQELCNIIKILNVVSIELQLLPRLWDDILLYELWDATGSTDYYYELMNRSIAPCEMQQSPC
jgi:hypothetical protein